MRSFWRGMVLAISLIPGLLLFQNFTSTGQVTLSKPAPCRASEMKELRALAAAGKPVTFKCTPSLNSKDRFESVTIEGAESSGMILDCRGADLGKVLNIRSRKYETRAGATQWSRPSDITIRNCRANAIQIYGMIRGGKAPPGEPDPFRESSRKDEAHTQRMRSVAPTRILLENIYIEARGTSSFYLSPGVTRVTFRNSKIVAGLDNDGQPIPHNHTAIYFDAESAYNIFQDNYIDVVTRAREVMAIDGSSHNKVIGNVFRRYSNGGIYVYRNCGENGAVRHSKPTHNHIINNYFNAKDNALTDRPAIYFSSRTWASLKGLNDCELDVMEDGVTPFPWGSSIDNRDRAIYNVAAENQIAGQTVSLAIRANEEPNELLDNIGVQRFERTSSGCYLDQEREYLREGQSVIRTAKVTSGCSKLTCNKGEIQSTPSMCVDAIAGVDDFYILAGQSNAVGQGLIRDITGLQKGLTLPGTLIWNNQSNKAETYALGVNSIQFPQAKERIFHDFGLEYSFLKRRQSEAPARQTLLLKYAKGGTSLINNGITHWNPFSLEVNLFDGMIQEIQFIMKAKKTLRGRLRCFVWVQGEADRLSSPRNLRLYKSAFNEMVEHVRVESSSPNTRVVMLRLSSRTDGASEKETAEFRDMQRSLVQQNPSYRWVNADDLQKRDSVHYTTDSLIVLGSRLYKACHN